MKRFYQDVDLRSRTAMTAFLEQHFRYPTMNSWNRSTSYACNLKVYQLDLDGEIENRLYDMIGIQEFFSAIRLLMDEFGMAHNYRWQAGMNGRSGGYLVLYQGEAKPSEYRSYCTHCGQRNYKTATGSDNLCGVCRQPARVNFEKPPTLVSVFPGRGTDDSEDFEDWSMERLRERVRLVQDFDRLADAIVKQAVWMAENCTVEEIEYLVPHTKKVLVGA